MSEAPAAMREASAAMHDAPPLAQAELSRAISRALEHLQATQDPDGSWHGDYGGPVFLLPTLIAATRIMGQPFDAEVENDFARYFKNNQNTDGGWPLHEGGFSYVYTTALCYVAMRLMGHPADDPDLQRAR
ncbi:MAG: prenyltransferase/squalene oxidase repeat-containing protein, partial [Pseudomonadota bacterium]